MLVDKICDELFKIELTRKSYDGNSYYTVPLINKDDQKLVKETILKVLNDNHDNELGELKGKVYTYEKIIANSNFKPFVLEKEDK